MTVTGILGKAREPESQLSVLRPIVKNIEGFDEELRAGREIYATLQLAPGQGGGDLDWKTLEQVRLPLVGVNGLTATWSAEIKLPQDVPVATPGDNETFRVQVEEFEYFDADPESAPKWGTPGVATRLVYADYLRL